MTGLVHFKKIKKGIESTKYRIRSKIKPGHESMSGFPPVVFYLNVKNYGK